MIKKFIKLLMIFLFLLIFNILVNKKTLFSKKLFNTHNSKIFDKIKQGVYAQINKDFKKNITYIDSLYISGTYRFGNFLISLNKAVIFCEFFLCKRIIIQSNKKIFINNKIFYRKYNLNIEPNHSFIYNNNSLKVSLGYLYYKLNFSRLGNIYRFHIFREEIVNNLPKVKVHHDDLYIYLRGGDIFHIINKSSPTYAQPPLCFYHNVLEKFNFRKIRIISEDKLNPILILLEKYYYIKYIKNNLKLDISYLVNSFNIISATSSFIVTIIKFNNNLKFLWEYDFYKLSDRYLHFHHSIYNFSFKYFIYKMKASEKYKKLMFPFINSKIQRKLMIEEKCDNNFYIIAPKAS